MEKQRYLPNEDRVLLKVADPRSQLITSLTKIVCGCPPKNPWTDIFKNKPVGLWTGPTSLAYLFLWLSETHPDLKIEQRFPIDWCHAYLDCGQESISSPFDLNGWGIKNEYLAYNAVKASVTKDMSSVDRLMEAVIKNFQCPPGDNEHLSGRAGTLALLRIVRRWVPSSAPTMNACMAPLIEHILAHVPWRFHGHNYIGAAHGSIGIITQIVLSDPSKALNPIVQSQLSELLNLQTEDGHWFITDDPKLGSPDLVHHCHGSPGFVMSLVKIRSFFPEDLRQRIDVAIERGRKEVWEKGLLRKEPNLCHGITGNILALGEWAQREHFLAHTTSEEIEKRKRDGSFIAGDDPYGLLWGEGGRAWGWLMMDIGKDLGYPSYTDI